MTDNELIAEFMNQDHLKRRLKSHLLDGFTKEQFYDSLSFHDSWDWLMPVIHVCNEKCKETGYPDGLELPQWHLIAVASNIKLVYFSVVEFIKWYNQNK